ncbi:MAG TPA: DMT family transporter [Xanthomonadaceae bacterium]|nr:DMT family transporter [Xanthomonadaceae bacterium]
MSATPGHARALLQIHFCVLLWGFTAILGKLITLPAVALVLWRMGLVAAVLLMLPRVWRALRALPARLWLAYAGIGVLVALHWLTFYGAIKLANASVAATCIALAPAFVAIVEPVLTGRRFRARELLLGVAVVPGVALVVGGIPERMHLGLWVGIASALLVALFGALNKRVVHHADALTVTALELGAGALFLAAVAPWLVAGGSAYAVPGATDAMLLATLAFVCTLLPFALALVALRELSAFTAQFAVNLEPVYAIVLAIVLLGEQHEVSPRFYLGVTIVLAAVFAQPLLRARAQRTDAGHVAESKALGESPADVGE